MHLKHRCKFISHLLHLLQWNHHKNKFNKLLSLPFQQKRVINEIISQYYFCVILSKYSITKFKTFLIIIGLIVQILCCHFNYNFLLIQYQYLFKYIKYFHFRNEWNEKSICKNPFFLKVILKFRDRTFFFSFHKRNNF